MFGPITRSHHGKPRNDGAGIDPDGLRPSLVRTNADRRPVDVRGGGRSLKLRQAGVCEKQQRQQDAAHDDEITDERHHRSPQVEAGPSARRQPVTGKNWKCSQHGGKSREFGRECGCRSSMGKTGNYFGRIWNDRRWALLLACFETRSLPRRPWCNPPLHRGQFFQAKQFAGPLSDAFHRGGLGVKFRAIGVPSMPDLGLATDYAEWRWSGGVIEVAITL